MRTVLHRRTLTALNLARLLPAYTLFAILKHFVDIQSLAAWAWQGTSNSMQPGAVTASAAAVVRISNFLGRSDRDCLERSLLLYRMLSKAGGDPVLFAGFEQTASGVRGHAWVSLDGQPVLETPARLAKFTPALAFGPRGVLLGSNGIRQPLATLGERKVLPTFP